MIDIVSDDYITYLVCCYEVRTVECNFYVLPYISQFQAEEVTPLKG